MTKVHNCYSISIAPNIIEKKIREYPTLILNNIANSKLRFKEIESPVVHLNEVTKNIGNQGHAKHSQILYRPSGMMVGNPPKPTTKFDNHIDVFHREIW